MFGMGAGLDWRCVQIEVKAKLGVTWEGQVGAGVLRLRGEAYYQDDVYFTEWTHLPSLRREGGQSKQGRLAGNRSGNSPRNTCYRASKHAKKQFFSDCSQYSDFDIESQ